MNRHWLWKLYFSFTLFSYAAMIWVGFIAPEFMFDDPFAYIDYAVMPVALLGLYGFCFNRRFLSRNIWKLYFAIFTFWTVYSNFVLNSWNANLPDSNWLVTTLIAIGALLILLPEYVAIFLYAFRNEQLWARDNFPTKMHT